VYINIYNVQKPKIYNSLKEEGIRECKVHLKRRKKMKNLREATP
jgi:hypothetical protein